MGGNTGRRISGAGAAPNSTPPSSASGSTQFTNTQYGAVVTDSAYSQARVEFTDYGNKPVTTAEIDNMIRHTGIPSDFGGTISVTRDSSGKVTLNINGEGVSMTRSIRQDGDGKTYVYNEYFRIDNGTKYDGRGWEIFNNQVNYISNNKSVYGDKPSYIKVSAAGNGPAFGQSDFNGYYTWLRFGYKPDLIDNATYTARYNSATGSNVRDMWAMMSTKQGRDWWRENGVGWRGTFDLSKGSDSRKILGDYSKERAKAKKRR